MAASFIIKVAATGDTPNSVVVLATFGLGVSSSMDTPNIINSAMPIIMCCRWDGTSDIGFSGTIKLALASNAILDIPNSLSSSLPFTIRTVGIVWQETALTAVAGFSIKSLASLDFEDVYQDNLNTQVIDYYGINTTTAGHFTYTNYPFNNIFKLGLDYYATSKNGLYKIGNTLDGTSIIYWEALTATSDLSTTHLKNIPDVYLDLRSSGDVFVKLNVDEATERTAYLIANSDSTGISKRRVKTHKGLRGTYWSVSVYGESTPTEINNLMLSVSQQKRNIK